VPVGSHPSRRLLHDRLRGRLMNEIYGYDLEDPYVQDMLDTERDYLLA
jgi:hypothetical protein